MTEDAPPRQLDTRAVAERLRVNPRTVTRYRQADRAQYGFPEPDGWLSGRPWWWAATIDAWAGGRPGRGVGGGRPERPPATRG